jgi:hypothetical protein
VIRQRASGLGVSHMRSLSPEHWTQVPFIFSPAGAAAPPCLGYPLLATNTAATALFFSIRR